MADSVMASPTKKSIFIIELSGQNSNPMIPDSFVSNHLNGNIQSTKLKLTSDASDRTWEVELDGQRFGRGWKHFSDHHCIRNDDVLSFRHDGDMVFHVIPFGRSFSKQIQYISSTSEAENDRSDDDDEHNIFDDDVYDDDLVGDDDDDENTTSKEELYPNKTSSKKRAITETEPSLENTYLIAHVTPSNLRRNNMYLPNKFARSNGLNNRQCEIDLRNEHGESWTMDLTHNKTTGQAFVRNGWASFCKSNKIKAESFCKFKLVQNGTRPVLQLCPNTEGSEIESEECLEPALMNQNKTVALEFKPYMLTGRLRVPASFGRANGIKEAGEITIVNKDGVEWKLHLGNMKGHEQYYIRGLKDYFIANGIKKVGDSFTLEAIRGGTNPILKICSKEASIDGYKTPQPRMIQASRAEEENETRAQKKARISVGGPSQPTRASNRSSAGPANLQHKQPLQPCSISDQVAKVKQSVVDALTDVRKFRSELEIKEHNLEAALLDIDVLGEELIRNVDSKYLKEETDLYRVLCLLKNAYLFSKKT